MGNLTLPEIWFRLFVVQKYKTNKYFMKNEWQNQFYYKISVHWRWTNSGLFFISQISAEASREEMERRLDKHMNKQNTQLNELMEKLEAQVSFLYLSFALTGSWKRSTNIWHMRKCILFHIFISDITFFRDININFMILIVA